MTKELTPSQAKREIEDRLSPRAMAYWNGWIDERINEMVAIAYREGIDAAVAEVEAWAAPSDDLIRELCIITTHDEAGRHFTQWSDHWETMESAGLIEVHRPVHAATGIPYGQEEWSLEVTDEGRELVEANPELHPVQE